MLELGTAARLWLPGRHRPITRDGRDIEGSLPRLLIRFQREWPNLVTTMTVLAVPLQDGKDIPRVSRRRARPDWLIRGCQHGSDHQGDGRADVPVSPDSRASSRVNSKTHAHWSLVLAARRRISSEARSQDECASSHSSTKVASISGEVLRPLHVHSQSKIQAG